MSVDHFILRTQLPVSSIFFRMLLKKIGPFNPKRVIVVFTGQEMFLDWDALNHHLSFLQLVDVQRNHGRCTNTPFLCQVSSRYILVSVDKSVILNE